VDFDADSGEPGIPKFLLDGDYVRGFFNRPNYDVTADGKRLIAITIPDANRSRRIEIVTNWLDELERLVPAGSR